MIEVFANGRKFTEWTTARVVRSIERIAAEFSLTLVARNPDGERVRLFPGDSVEISVNGNKVISGYVDKLSTSFSTGSHSVTVSGSEKTSDLADCCVTDQFEWNNKKMDEIIRIICANFGLQFSNEMSVDVGQPFKKFSAEPGAKAIDTISKLCKERGVLCCSNGLGKLFLLKPDSCERGPALQQGENLVSASVDFSLVDRYSDYTVYGTGCARKKVVATAKDSDVTRSRPLLVIDSNAVEKDKVQARADWECKVRKAKSMGFHAVVCGWEHSSGIWKPGVICSFYAPELYVENSIDLLVSSVEYAWGEGGEKTSLNLVSPDVFIPQPESKKVKSHKVKSDPWNAVKKAVKGK